MQRLDGNRAISLARAATLLVVALLATGPTRALARPTAVLLFNLTPAKQYDVRRNGTLLASVASSSAASAAFDADLTTGDALVIAEGANLQPPPPPLFSALASPGPGCARATWLPSGDPTVVGYSISYGKLSVAGGQAPDYECMVDAGAASTRDVCQLSAGTYYFAVRTRNHLGMMSAYSSERSVLIVVASVLISSFDARVRDDGVELSWRIEAGEIVRGVRVYRGEGEAVPAQIADLPMEAVSYIDRTTLAGTRYTYRIAAVKESGEEVPSSPATVSTPAAVLSLGQNWPNPFNPSTTIPFTLPAPARVVIRIHDVRGARVATVVEEGLSQGRHFATWDGTGENGERVASGTYFCVLTAGDRSLSRKVVVLK
jgi:FlgD Ig-like domain